MIKIETEEFFKRPKLRFPSWKWLGRINSKVNSIEGKVSKFEDREIETTQNETHRRETKK